MLKGLSQGWPMGLSNLKTALETDVALPFVSGSQAAGIGFA